MEFFDNNPNDRLNFKINIEGIDIDKIEPRLIIKNEKSNYLFFGKINDSICTFDIPELASYKKGDEGEIKFEIISEDLYFPVWTDTFEIKTKRSVKIEELYQEITQKPKPVVSANAILEKTTPKEEVKEEIKEEVKPKIKPEIRIVEEPIVETKVEEPKEDTNTTSIMDNILKESEEKERLLAEELSNLEEEVEETPEIVKENIKPKARKPKQSKTDNIFYKNSIKKFNDI